MSSDRLPLHGVRFRAAGDVRLRRETDRTIAESRLELLLQDATHALPGAGAQAAIKGFGRRRQIRMRCKPRGRGDTPFAPSGADVDRSEAGFAEDAGQRRRLLQDCPSRGRRRRLEVRKCVRDGAEPDLDMLHAIEPVPHDDRGATPRPRHARHLRERAAEIRKQHDAEDAEDRIEAAISEVEPRAIHDASAGAGESCVDEAVVEAGDHARRDVDAGDGGTAARRQQGERARSRRDVEEALTRRDGHGVESRLGELPGQGFMDRFVLGRVVIPAWLVVVGHAGHLQVAPSRLAVDATPPQRIRRPLFSL
jgi:hypothetical protein